VFFGISSKNQPPFLQKRAMLKQDNLEKRRNILNKILAFKEQ
jgi:hypothetical protein